MKQKYGILVDSSCTFTNELINDNKVEIVPLIITNKQTNESIPDTSITYEQLIKNLDAGQRYSTSCSVLGTLIEKVKEMLTKYEHVFFLPISHGISSQYANALMIKDDFGDSFHVICSTTTGIGNEFLLNKLIALIKKDLKPNEIVVILTKELDYITTYFSCEQIAEMRSGGRLKQLMLKTINFFHKKPIICFNSTNHVVGFGANFEINLLKMIKHLSKKSFHLETLTNSVANIGLYVSGHNKLEVDVMLSLLSNKFQIDKKQIMVRNVPYAILTHTLPKAYGFCVEIKH